MKAKLGLGRRPAPGPRFVVHVGYPKTATTTLQMHLWPQHPDIDYLGKFLPHHGYRDAVMSPLVNDLMVQFETEWDGAALRAMLDAARADCDRPVMLLSSENFIHPWSNDPGLVARRLALVAPGAQILIVLREQASLLNSFFRRHGGYGQYLYLNKYIDEDIRLPLDGATWMDLQFRFPTKNLLGYLDFNTIIAGYERCFGADQVTVLAFETLQATPGVFARQLCETLHLPMVQAWARVGDLRENAKASSTWPRETGDLDASIPPEWLERARDRFRAGNAALAARRGLDLAGLGYAC